MIVTYTDRAKADLERIGDYIALDSPLRAVTFVQEITDRCERLAGMPQAFPLVPGHEDEGIRRRPHGSYLIFYRVAEDRVDILHVLHAAQDYEAILFPGEAD